MNRLTMMFALAQPKTLALYLSDDKPTPVKTGRAFVQPKLDDTLP